MENQLIHKNTKHGYRKHRLYGIWRQMLQRCNNPLHSAYTNYGARGIKVCYEWHNIANFINDMNDTFIDGLTLDRIDNNKGYYKDNCRWADRVHQNRNVQIIRKNNKTGYKGVCWHITNKTFIAGITINSKRKHIGSFNTALEGALAYDKYIVDNNLEHTRNFS